MDFEQSFVDRLINHDDLAFAQFYEQSVDHFFRYIVSHYGLEEQEVYDILSDVYLKIRDNIDKYDPKYKFWQFIRTILKNHCKDYFKSSKLLSFSDLTSSQHEDSSDEDVIDALLQEDNLSDLIDTQYTYELIQEALKNLDEESQELIYSRYILQYSYETLATLYNLTNESVRQKISRALKKLRTLLK